MRDNSINRKVCVAATASALALLVAITAGCAASARQFCYLMVGRESPSAALEGLEAGRIA